MSAITMSDVVSYFNAYKAKYNEDCTLPLDAIEQIMEEASTEDAMIEAMHEAQHTDDGEEETSDRSTDTVVIDRSEGSAFAYAEKMDEQFSKDLDVLAEAALTNKRGGAVIMFDLFRLYGEDTVCDVWPVPGSKADNDRMLGNRLADKYATRVTKEDGTEGAANASWYSQFVEYSPRGKTLFKQRESLRGIAAKETGPHILDEHKHLIGDAVKTKTERSAIDTKINNAKGAITRAVLLAQRIRFCNKTTTLGAEIVKDGDEVARSNKLVFIYNTEDRTKFDVLTIGQFLALKVTEGGKYSEIVGSTRRAPRTTETATVPDVNSLDMFDKVSATYATFWDKLEEQTNAKDMKAYNALLTRLNAAGSDDLILSLNTIATNIDAVLSKPGISKRLADLLTDGKKKAA